MYLEVGPFLMHKSYQFIREFNNVCVQCQNINTPAVKASKNDGNYPKYFTATSSGVNMKLASHGLILRKPKNYCKIFQRIFALAHYFF